MELSEILWLPEPIERVIINTDSTCVCAYSHPVGSLFLLSKLSHIICHAET
jgi:hypothetical protein